MKTLADLIGQRSTASKTDPFWRQFGMRRNPFPTARTIIPEVIYNQDTALEAFGQCIGEILSSEHPRKKSLSITGGTGSGKTHFLRHCQHLLGEYEDAKKLVIVEFLAGTSSISSLLREILRAADDLCKANGDMNLFSAVIRSMKNANDYGSVSFGELRQVLSLLYRSTKPNFQPPDRDRLVGTEQLRDLAYKWISGATLTQTERKYLGVFSRLATASLMARVVSELITFAYSKSILSGVVICIDEIEALFTGQNSTAKIQQFLQDLRFLFDEAVKDRAGYALFVLSASTQTGASRLKDFNYPVFQRLGFESRHKLMPLSSFDEVSEFANTYIEYEKLRSNLSGTRKLLSDEDLNEAYQKSTATNILSTRSAAVSQAQLLEALHDTVERKRVAN